MNLKDLLNLFHPHGPSANATPPATQTAAWPVGGSAIGVGPVMPPQAPLNVDMYPRPTMGTVALPPPATALATPALAPQGPSTAPAFAPLPTLAGPALQTISPIDALQGAGAAGEPLAQVGTISPEVQFAPTPTYDPAMRVRNFGPFSYDPGAGHVNRLELAAATLQDIAAGLRGQQPAALAGLDAQDRQNTQLAQAQDQARRLGLSPRQMLAMSLDPAGWARAVNLGGLDDPGDAAPLDRGGTPLAGGGARRIDSPVAALPSPLKPRPSSLADRSPVLSKERRSEQSLTGTDKPVSYEPLGPSRRRRTPH